MYEVRHLTGVSETLEENERQADKMKAEEKISKRGPSKNSGYTWLTTHHFQIYPVCCASKLFDS